jgi:hypothetical protein
MKKTIIAALLAASSMSALASDYFVVVPVPNRSATAGNILVTLNGYSLPAGVIGRAYAGFDFNSVLQVLGDPGYSASSVRWSVVAGALPAGLTLGADGKLTGFPTAAATSSFQVMAAYKTKAGEQAYQVLVSDVSIVLAADSAMPAGVQGAQYSYDLKSRLNVTGDAQYTPAQVSWTVASGALPSGLQLNANGTITGVPDAEGTSPFNIKASYLSKTGQQSYQVIVGAISVSLKSAALPSLTAGTALTYDLKQNLTISGDAAYVGDGANVNWNLSGSLPAGLSLGSDGRISGTPTAVGSSSITVTAGYKAKSSPPATYSMSVTANLKDNGGFRTWSDGTYAASCQGYLSPTAPYFYTGATGNGVYRIKPSGTPMDVYCDMVNDGGGWILLMKQAAGDGATLQGDATYWTNGTPLNDTVSNLNMNNGNLVSVAFAAFPTSQLKLQASNETTTQKHTNTSSMTAQAAFSNTHLTKFSDPVNVYFPSAPNWFVHTTTYPTGAPLSSARFGFNFSETWTAGDPTGVRCAARWGWAGNQDTTTSDGSHDVCGGLGGWGVAYGSEFMNNNKGAWNPATLYLWGK